MYLYVFQIVAIPRLKVVKELGTIIDPY